MLLQMGPLLHLSGFLLKAAIAGNNAEELVRLLCCCELGRMFEDDGFSVSP